MITLPLKCMNSMALLATPPTFTMRCVMSCKLAGASHPSPFTVLRALSTTLVIRLLSLPRSLASSRSVLSQIWTLKRSLSLFASMSMMSLPNLVARTLWKSSALMLVTIGSRALIIGPMVSKWEHVHAYVDTNVSSICNDGC